MQSELALRLRTAAADPTLTEYYANAMLDAADSMEALAETLRYWLPFIEFEEYDPTQKGKVEMARHILKAYDSGKVTLPEGELDRRIYLMHRDFSLSTLERSKFWAVECRSIAEALILKGKDNG